MYRIMKEKAALVGEKIRSVSCCSLYCSIIVYSRAFPLFYFLIGQCTRPFHLLSFHILILISTCHGAHSPPSHPTPFTSSIDPINAIYFIFSNLLSFNLTPYASLPPFLTLPHRALSYLIPHIYQKNEPNTCVPRVKLTVEEQKMLTLFSLICRKTVCSTLSSSCPYTCRGLYVLRSTKLQRQLCPRMVSLVLVLPVRQRMKTWRASPMLVLVAGGVSLPSEPIRVDDELIDSGFF